MNTDQPQRHRGDRPRGRRDRDPRHVADERATSARHRSTRQEWLPTGDLGYFTDDGLVVCGRAKELITVAGRNVFPTEIERIAGQIDGVRDGCVVAIGTGEASARPGLVIAAEFKGDDEPAARSAWWRASHRNAAWCPPTWCS